MAFVLSHLSEIPEPQQGETTALLVLDSHPQHGYRVKALAAESGRILGRFMSDCPLSVCQTALLWVTTHEWQVQEGQGSMGVERVLQQVPRPTPMEPPPGVHIRDVLDLLAGNLPPRPGEQRMLTGPRQLGEAQQLPYDKEEDRPRRRRQAQRRRKPISEDAKELGGFLGDARRMLAEGASPEEVEQMLAEYIGGVASGRPQAVAPAYAPPAPAYGPGYPQGLSQQAPPQVPGFASGMQPMMQIGPGGLRPLLPGEIPQGLSPEQQQQFYAMTAGTDAARQKVEAGIAHDYHKYLRHVPPLSREQQAELVEAQRDLSRKRSQPVRTPEPEPEIESELMPGQPFQTEDGQLWVMDEEGELHALVQGPDGQFYLVEDEDEEEGEEEDVIDADDASTAPAKPKPAPVTTTKGAPAKAPQGGKGAKVGKARGGRKKPEVSPTPEA